MAEQNIPIGPDNPGAKPPRRIPVASAVIGVLLLLLFIGAAIYLKSPSFNALVRSKVVAQLEAMTGGRVQLKSLQWNIAKLDVEINDLTIHGLEAPGEVPYAHIDHLTIHAKIISLWQKEIGLRYLGITHPVVHLIVYPDGSTNQPTPKTQTSSSADPLQTVFNLAVDKADISNGLLLLNDRKIPFNLTADKLAVDLTFTPNADPNQREYDSSIRVGALSTDYKNTPPLVSNLEAQIALHPSGAEIKTLRWSSPRSKLEASGRVVNFNDPRVTLNYDATLSAAEAAQLLKMPEVRGGTLDLAGKGQYHASQYSASGNLTIKDLSYRKGTTNLEGLNARADYAIDPRKLELKDLRAALFGGTARGTITIADWSDSQRQRGRARMDLAGISVARLVANEGPAALKKIDIDSNASGLILADWIGSPANANAKLSLRFDPRGAPPPALPLTGILDAQYNGRRDSLSIAQLDLHTRGTQLTAQGTLGLRDRDKDQPDSSIHFTLNTSDLGEFTPVLAAIKVDQPPVTLDGTAQFTGAATGSLAHPHLHGHLAVSNFAVLLAAAAPPHPAATPVSAPAPAPKTAPAKSIHWDSLSTDLDYTPAALSVTNGMLHRGSATVAFDATAALRHQVGRRQIAYPTKQIPFHAKVNVKNATLKDIQAIAGYDYPVSGTLQADLNASGTAENLSGGGAVQIANGSAYGQPFKTLQADLHLAGQEVRIGRLSLAEDGGVVNGSGNYNLTTKAFAAKITGSGFNLAHFKQLQKGSTHLAGTAEFSAQASGTVEAPSVDAHLQISNAVMNGENIGAVIFDGKTQGDTLHFTASAANSRIAKLNLNGTVRLRGDFPGTAHAVFSDFDFAPLLKMYTQGNVTGQSRVNGYFDVSGPLKKPALLTAKGEIPSLSLSVESFKLQNQGPIRFALANQVAQLEQLDLVGPDTDLVASGSLALTGAKALNANLNGKVNLKLLQSFNSDISSSGITTISVTARGTLAHPNLQGEIDLRNAAVAFLDLPNGLSNMNGKLVFTQDRLQVQQLTAQTGGGQLNIAGFATYRNGLLFDLTATGNDVRVRYQGTSVVANADLRLTGTLRGATLSGDVVITKFAMTQQFDLALYIAQSKEPPSTPDPTSIANRLRLNVHVSSAPQLAVQTSLATLSGEIDLNVRGSVLNPILLGRINIAEGDILFQGTKYHLERGDITFTNALRIDPILNVEASATIRDYDITLGFHGPIDRLSTTYRSEPPLSTTDIISLLAFQRTTEETANSQNQTSFTESAQNAVLGEALNAAVSSRIQKLFGISRVKIDPQGGGLDNNKPSITVEQSVSSNLTVTFVTYPTQSNQQLIQVEYNVNKNISIVGVRDQYGVLSIDVRLRQRRR